VFTTQFIPSAWALSSKPNITNIGTLLAVRPAGGSMDAGTLSVWTGRHAPGEPEFPPLLEDPLDVPLLEPLDPPLPEAPPLEAPLLDTPLEAPPEDAPPEDATPEDELLEDEPLEAVPPEDDGPLVPLDDELSPPELPPDVPSTIVLSVPHPNAQAHTNSADVGAVVRRVILD
jgi:hypothetical protein